MRNEDECFLFHCWASELNGYHNSLPQRHNKSLHHGAFSETAVFFRYTLAPVFEKLLTVYTSI